MCKRARQSFIRSQSHLTTLATVVAAEAVVIVVFVCLVFIHDQCASSHHVAIQFLGVTQPQKALM
jgi:hypothetical protein